MTLLTSEEIADEQGLDFTPSMRLALHDTEEHTILWKVSVKSSSIAFRAVAKELRSAMRISKATYVITRPDRIIELLEQLDGEKVR